MRHASVSFYGFPPRLCILPILLIVIYFLAFVFVFFLFLFVNVASFFFSMLSLELCTRSSGIFLSSRLRTRLTTACITGYG